MARAGHEHQAVAIVIGWPGITPEQLEANKVLIAAAPDLLGALEACEAALAEVPCLSNKQEASRVQARAAIAKAKGGGK